MPMNRERRPSRLSRILARRLERDCEIYWPGGPGNAAFYPVASGWYLVTADGQDAPCIYSDESALRLVRDGFITYRWPNDPCFCLIHIEHTGRILEGSPAMAEEVAP